MIDHPVDRLVMIKKPRTERGPPAGSSLAKKAKSASEAKYAAASKVTVTLDPKLLKCSVCCSGLTPPIFQCSSGHTTCSECCEDLEYDCSLCGKPNDTRCRAVEQIICGMTVPCSFREHGCADMIPFTEKLVHEESCPHAPCYCPIAGCRSYARQSLHDHINLQHPTVQHTNVTGGNFCPLRMRDEEPARFVSLGSGRTFLLVVDRSVPTGRGLSVIHLVNEQIREDDFKYKIQVYTRTGILCLSGETQSVERLTKAYQAGASLFVSDAMWSPQDSPVYIELRK
uniref:Uncharacterized protein n=1 Tax=Avena sativa TaxID=4498 RepID=A0ACD5TRU3_AVESA